MRIYQFTMIFVALCASMLCFSAPKKVYVSRNMHILKSQDKDGRYAHITKTKDSIKADVYNSTGRLIYKYNLLELTSDTCIYDGWQVHYFYDEICDRWLYKNNEMIEHIYYRSGKPIFRKPVQVSDTIWTYADYIVFPREAQTYCIVQSVDDKGIIVNGYDCKTNELVEKKCYSELYYGNKMKRTGEQRYYINGKLQRIENYNEDGIKIKMHELDSHGNIVIETSYDTSDLKNNYWMEKKYYYKDNLLRAHKIRNIQNEIEVQYFNIDGTSSVISTLTDSIEDIICLEPDKMPMYPGGADALRRFLTDEVTYPAPAQRAGMQGKVIVGFTIGKDGSVTNIAIVRPCHRYFDAEAVRVIQQMPKWKPALRNGKPVSVHYTAPINFKLR